MLHLLLGISNAYLLIVTTPVLKAAVKLAKVKSHSNNVHDIIIAHVISVDTQTNRCRKCKAILGPAGCVLCTQLAGRK